jgi:hypothetical protein
MPLDDVAVLRGRQQVILFSEHDLMEVARDLEASARKHKSVQKRYTHRFDTQNLFGVPFEFCQHLARHHIK